MSSFDDGGSFDFGILFDDIVPVGTLPEVAVEIAFSPPFGALNILTGTTWTSDNPTDYTVFGLSDGVAFDLTTGPVNMQADGSAVPVVAGLTYTIMGEFSVTSGGTVPVEFGIELAWYVDGAWIGWPGVGGGGVSAEVTSTSTPVSVIKTVVAPAGATSVRVFVICETASAAGEFYYTNQLAMIDAPVTEYIATGTAPTVVDWTDITAWVRAFNTQAGNQHELGQIQASTLTLTLDNRDARFNPWNTTGPYGPPITTTGLVPQMPVRVTATIPPGCPGAGTTYPVFYGYIDSWTPKWSNPLSPDIDIGATDMLGMLAVADFNSTAYHDQLVLDSAACLYRLADPGPLYAVDQLGLNAQGNYVGGVTFGTAGPFITDTNTSVTFGGGYVTLDSILSPSLGLISWSAECWLQFPATPPAGVSQTIWHNDLGNVQGGVILEWYGPTGNIAVSVFVTGGGIQVSSHVADGNWHHIVVNYLSGSDEVFLYIDGKIAGSNALSAHLTDFGGPWYLGDDGITNLAPFAGNLANFAVYTPPLTADQIANHFAIGDLGGAVSTSGVRIGEILNVGGVPAALQSLEAGISEIQPISVVGLSVDAALNNGGATASSLVGTKILDYIQTVNTTEAGLIFQNPAGVFTFYDRHHALTASLTPEATYEDAEGSSFFYSPDSFVPGEDNLDLWNEIIASAQAYPDLLVVGGNQVVESVVSQRMYGKRTYPSASGLLVTADADALDFAQYIGLRYSQPAPRIQSIAMDSFTNGGGNLTEMLGRGLWDKVLVVHHGLVGGSALSQISLIEGIEHTVTPDSWTTVFRLVPADPNLYFILNNATRGQLAGTGSTAANVLGF